jgi:hypothetical protein
MARQFFNKKAGVHSQSMGLAVTSKEEALRRNEELRQAGIAAEHPIREDGQIMPLEFRDREGRRRAHEAFGVGDFDAGYGDAPPPRDY